MSPAGFCASAALAMLAAGLLLAVNGSGTPRSIAASPSGKKPLDPAAWGSDHVGQGVPMYMDSGECLFCHRAEVGSDLAAQQAQSHDSRARGRQPALAALKADAASKSVGRRSAAADGRRAGTAVPQTVAGLRQGRHAVAPSPRLAAAAAPKLEKTANPHWDAEAFAKECAGCHTTAVQSPDARLFGPVDRLLLLPRRRQRASTPTIPS